MGQRGPAPLPSGVLRLRGTLRNDRVYDEPKPAGGIPRCPAWLSAEAKSAWKQLAPDLVATGLLTRLDRNALSRYCTLWARWRKAEDFIAKHGDVYTLKDAAGGSRCVMQFPQVAIAHRLSRPSVGLAIRGAALCVSRVNLLGSGTRSQPAVNHCSRQPREPRV